jgi:tetratricopeptide (TPR) repeat protein
VINLDPKNAQAYYDRGNAYYNKGDRDRAIADLTQVITLDPKFAHLADISKKLEMLQKSQTVAPSQKTPPQSSSPSRLRHSKTRLTR